MITGTYIILYDDWWGEGVVVLHNNRCDEISPHSSQQNMEEATHRNTTSNEGGIHPSSSRDPALLTS